MAKASGIEKFGKYVLVDRIGRGGMSEVFLARTEGIEGFQRKVALKRIFSSLTLHKEFVQSFIHEAKIGGMLYHHNVVQTLDFGRYQDSYFIALEYIEGTNLGRILARCRDLQTPIPPTLFLQIALQVCEGLDYIHHAKIEGTDLELVHRDIKPSNLLITAQGLVKISDFGVVKAGARVGDRTMVGAVKGTIGYMSPEQARGETVTRSSDLFSLGTLLFEMATLERLYGEGDEMVILKRVRESDFQVPIEAAAGYIPGLDRVLKRLLAKEPRSRYPDARQVDAALRALPVAMGDRSALVNFVDSLGLFEPKAREGPRQRSTREKVHDITRRVLGKPRAVSSPTFDVVRKGEIGPMARTVILVVTIALLGLGASYGSYRLVKAQLTPEQSAENLAMGEIPKDRSGTPVQVYLYTTPASAQVLVNGTLVARSPTMLPVYQGQTVGVRLPGYKEWKKVVDVDRSSDIQQWVVALQPAVR